MSCVSGEYARTSLPKRRAVYVRSSDFPIKKLKRHTNDLNIRVIYRIDQGDQGEHEKTIRAVIVTIRTNPFRRV